MKDYGNYSVIIRICKQDQLMTNFHIDKYHFLTFKTVDYFSGILIQTIKSNMNYQINLKF